MKSKRAWHTLDALKIHCFKGLCLECGIKSNACGVESSSQNGLAKRTYRVIKEQVEESLKDEV